MLGSLWFYLLLVDFSGFFCFVLYFWFVRLYLFSKYGFNWLVDNVKCFFYYGVDKLGLDFDKVWLINGYLFGEVKMV